MTDQLAHITYYDPAWIPHLNPGNILDYFCQKTNPFYDKLCNNEIAKMQRLAPEQMTMMTGVEFTVFHVQYPGGLYVIRKQDRIGPDSTTPLVDYYIINGVIHQAPDLNSIIQSRVLNSTLSLKSALEEFQALASFNPTTGHSWKSQQQQNNNKTSKSTEKPQQRPDEFTRFQQKVGMLMKTFNENNP